MTYTYDKITLQNRVADALERIAAAQERGVAINERILELHEASHKIMKKNSAHNEMLNKFLKREGG